MYFGALIGEYYFIKIISLVFKDIQFLPGINR
jgi:hypothetical protein